MSEADTVSPVVLRNKGAPIPLARLGEDGSPALNAEDEVVYEKHWLRIDCNVYAEMEDLYGNAQALQTALDQKPVTTVRKIIAMCLKLEPWEVGARMDMPQFAKYLEAVSTAYLISSGVDPTVVQQIMAKRLEELETTLRPPMPPTVESPGTNGLESGASSVEVSTSSGV